MKIIFAAALAAATSLAHSEPPSDGSGSPARSGEAVSDVVRASISNAKQLGIACRLYSMDHDGHYPFLLMDVYPDYVGTKTLFACPLCPKEQFGFAYFWGKVSDPPKQVLLYSKAPTPGGQWIVVFNDLTCKLVAEEPQPPEPEAKGAGKAK